MLRRGRRPGRRGREAFAPAPPGRQGHGPLRYAGWRARVPSTRSWTLWPLRVVPSGGSGGRVHHARPVLAREHRHLMKEWYARSEKRRYRLPSGSGQRGETMHAVRPALTGGLAEDRAAWLVNIKYKPFGAFPQGENTNKISILVHQEPPRTALRRPTPPGPGPGRDWRPFRPPRLSLFMDRITVEVWV
jgi:hypothetical protein